MLLRLLRHNLRPAQLIGFVLANLLGGIILLVGVQAYTDFDRFMAADEGLLSGGQLVITKPVSGGTTIGTLLGLQNGFSQRDIDELQSQPGVNEVGTFVSAQCQVRGIIALGSLHMQTDMFLEAVPDAFVDVKVDGSSGRFHGWSASTDDRCIPIILPRNYLNLYNYGYASTRGLPQLSEGLASSFPLHLQLIGSSETRTYEARIVGFSNRINTILAPADFIAEANIRFGSSQEKTLPSRLVVATQAQQASNELLSYLERKGYVIEGNADAIRMQSLVHGILYVISAVGIAITTLAFFLLAICISLLTERNRQRIATLYAIGYPLRRIALPYQLLVLVLDVVVWSLSALLAFCAYLEIAEFLKVMAPDFTTQSGTLLCLTTVVAAIISIGLHLWLVRRKIDDGRW